MRPASRAVALATAVAVAIGGMPARAQTGASAGIPMIRDAEIEQLLREYTQPILRVAGLSQQNVQVVIINENAFNAFVMDAHRIFVISGALMQATTPNQMIGVFAHETGHIAGGHLSKMRQELANAQTAAIVAMLLGVGAMVAGARSNSMDMSQVGMAALSAPQSYLQHTLLAYQRAQEEQADRAGVRFLTMSGQSAKGMYETFKHFADEVMFSSSTIDPYVQNHPMPIGAHGGARGNGKDAVLGQEGLGRAAIPPRHDAGEACTASPSGRTRSCGIIRPPIPACRRAMRAPSRRIVSATCAPPSGRSTA